MNGKTTALTGFAVQFDPALMGTDDVTNQAKADAEPFSLPSQRMPGSVEAVKDPVMFFLWNTGALVLDP